MRWVVAVLAMIAAACSSGGTVDESPGESVAVLRTTTTPPAPTTESSPTTENSQPTEETTTSIVATETTAPQPNINNVALCQQARDPGVLETFRDSGVPNPEKLTFYGNCTGLPGDLDYGWIYPGGPGYVYEIDTTGFVYDARGFHSSPLPPIGSPDVPWDWDTEHPEFQEYDPLTLRELAELEPGTAICGYTGTTKRYSQDAVLSRVGLATRYNKYTNAEPFTYVAVYLLQPDGTEDPVPWFASSAGVIEYEFGGWTFGWTAKGKCKDLPTDT